MASVSYLNKNIIICSLILSIKCICCVDFVVADSIFQILILKLNGVIIIHEVLVDTLEVLWMRSFSSVHLFLSNSKI